MLQNIPHVHSNHFIRLQRFYVPYTQVLRVRIKVYGTLLLVPNILTPSLLTVKIHFFLLSFSFFLITFSLCSLWHLSCINSVSGVSTSSCTDRQLPHKSISYNVYSCNYLSFLPASWPGAQWTQLACLSHCSPVSRLRTDGFCHSGQDPSDPSFSILHVLFAWRCKSSKEQKL